jgi:hypothetical protein
MIDHRLEHRFEYGLRDRYRPRQQKIGFKC